MPPTASPHKRPRTILSSIEFLFEGAIFASRWLLAPAYVLLAATLAVLTYKTGEEFVQLVLNLRIFDESHAILQALTVVDLVLVLNLILMVIFVGYINFVSKLNVGKLEDWPNWMTHLGYSGLKVQLLGSIIAVSSVRMLRTFIEISDTGKANGSQLLWLTIIYTVLLAAVLIIALVNLISKNAHLLEQGQQLIEPKDED